MRLKIAAAVALLGVVAGCAPQVSLLPAGSLVRNGCYTVDIYDDAYGRNEVQAPKEGLPANWNAYLGVWGDSAWNGGQCHELWVTEVFQDGSAVIIDTTAPFGDLRAVSHRGPARINSAGDLVVAHRSGRSVVYSFEGSRLRGLRYNEDGSVDQVLLSRQPQ
ncbi:hypothetical protein [Pontivivens insulae]|uniref:Lipoprotein n=1 Tax=Pontivivens insulae TaxID=1639689 RepID=A0A2R8ACS8_9RHOB|nr:hypothetical protein [Pontivivens insulae]RED13806.1 hypothetical protein DFR53_1151 [Pontivivens insulae]SPF29880.1 hypothetical protein POI8812_02204 [Pontivivens insulae]